MERMTYPEMLSKQRKLLEELGFDFENFQNKTVQEKRGILFNLQNEYLGNDKEINNITPVVSVCIPTYQHVNYIKSCIEGALMQKTSFPFEIIIGDDGSNDGTADLCKKYAEENPDKIRFYNRIRELSRVFDTEGHIDRSYNWWWTLEEARGKYIAICEGDDYWIDPLKLQKQVDFLEEHEDYGLICSDVHFYYQDDKTFTYDFFSKKKYPIKYTFEDFLEKAWFIGTCTWLYRKTLMPDLFDYNFKVGDLPLLLKVSSRSKIKYLNETTAVYRVLKHSASHFPNFSKHMSYHRGILKIQLFYTKKNDREFLERNIIKRWLFIAMKISVKHRKYIQFLYYSNQFLLCYMLPEFYQKIKKDIAS